LGALKGLKENMVAYMQCLDEGALNLLFYGARTARNWQKKEVADEVLYKLHSLFVMGPTSNNAQPARVLYIQSKEAKSRLWPCLSKGNLEKSMAAPVTAIIGYDLKFYAKLDELSGLPGSGARFVKNPSKVEPFAFRNCSLQGGYFIIAARALGLDVGPMSGFDNLAVDNEFFAGTNIKSNFLCNIGFGDFAKIQPRPRRVSFEEISDII
tara:strand:+ start:76 stop:705 length:630 start_codon:yes stop_codon:yes gene_type:complete